MTNKQIYINMCINQRGTREIRHTTFKTMFLDHSFKTDYRVLKMMCKYWRVDLATGLQLLSNYVVTGNENNNNNNNNLNK